MYLRDFYVRYSNAAVQIIYYLQGVTKNMWFTTSFSFSQSYERDNNQSIGTGSSVAYIILVTKFMWPLPWVASLSAPKNLTSALQAWLSSFNIYCIIFFFRSLSCLFTILPTFEISPQSLVFSSHGYVASCHAPLFLFLDHSASYLFIIPSSCSICAFLSPCWFVCAHRKRWWKEKFLFSFGLVNAAQRCYMLQLWARNARMALQVAAMALQVVAQGSAWLYCSVDVVFSFLFCLFSFC